MKTTYNIDKLLELVSNLKSFCKYNGDCQTCSYCYDTNEVEEILKNHIVLQKRIKELEKANRKYRGSFSNYIVNLKKINQELLTENNKLREELQNK